MELQDWLKTAASRPTLQTQRPFCLDGRLWQGFRGGPMPVEESQLTLEELQAVEDLDGTMARVWFRVAQRLESRHSRKVEEYGKRRMSLRQERQQVRDSLKHDREAGLPVAASDLQELERLDRRMLRLADPVLEDAYYKAREMAEGRETPAAAAATDACPDCGKVAPPDRSASKWLRGHRMTCKGKRSA
jgi:hypothetical protein